MALDRMPCVHACLFIYNIIYAWEEVYLDQYEYLHTRSIFKTNEAQSKLNKKYCKKSIMINSNKTLTIKKSSFVTNNIIQQRSLLSEAYVILLI